MSEPSAQDNIPLTLGRPMAIEPRDIYFTETGVTISEYPYPLV